VEHPLFKKSISQTISDFSSGKTAMLLTYTEYAALINESIHTNVIGRVGYEPVPGKTPVSVGWNFGLNPFTPKRASNTATKDAAPTGRSHSLSRRIKSSPYYAAFSAIFLKEA